jgi:predicted MPP superfamily phosphohydrolase
MPNIFFQKTFKLIFLGFIIILVSSFILGGFFNARQPEIQNVNIEIARPIEKPQSIHAVMISDVHLSSLIGRKHFARIVSIIKTIQPDIVFIAGDLVDGDLNAVIRKNSLAEIKSLSPPMGIYAVTGNHEFIGGAEKAVDYIEQYNVKFLRDTAILIDSSFYLIGREDIEKNRFQNNKRKSLNELMNYTDKTHPLILLDHQPVAARQSAQAGIDLQFSGHTHNGQLWPLNYITSAMFENSYGYQKIQNMQMYTSSGAGTWGPPVRIGTQPEIVNARILFKPN